MELHEDTTEELSGVGSIVVDGTELGEVQYWLWIVPEPGRVLADGLITASESFLQQIAAANTPKLTLDDGYVVQLKCEGGANGVRWVKAMVREQETRNDSARRESS